MCVRKEKKRSISLVWLQDELGLLKTVKESGCVCVLDLGFWSSHCINQSAVKVKQTIVV